MTQGTAASYVLALLGIPGVGRRTAHKLLLKFPTLAHLAAAPPDDRQEALRQAPRRISGDLMDLVQAQLPAAERTVADHRDAGLAVLALPDPEFPPQLARIDDPPLVLFVEGDQAALVRVPCVAVIGTRKPTPVGTEVADRIARWLVRTGYTVVSGLAKGIDGTAHRAALAERGCTVAVLAEGLDHIYPPAHRSLAKTIARSGGALVSEYPLGYRAQRSSFVDRDRLQSGLSVAVIPVQTDVKGGTMHTVGFARRQGRFLACPHPVESEATAKQWAGIWALISAGGVWSFQKTSYSELETRLMTAAMRPERYETFPAAVRLPLDAPQDGTTADSKIPETAVPSSLGAVVLQPTQTEGPRFFGPLRG